MRSFKFIEILSLVSASFLCLRNVNAAIPTCSSDGSGAPITIQGGYEYCNDNGKLKKIDGSAWADLDVSSINKSGLYFLKNDGSILAETTSVAVELINVTVSDSGEVTFTEGTIKDGFTAQGDGTLIKCTSSNKCSKFEVSESNTVYFVDNNGGLIKYDSEATAVATEERVKGYYINGNAGKQLIKCDATCTEVSAQDGDVYWDVVETGNVILCTTGDDGSVGCVSEQKEGYFVNSSAITSSAKPLIDCSNGCKEDVPPEPYSYYINGGKDKSKVISCSSVKNTCKLEAGNSGDNFVGIEGEEKNKLIKCSGEDKVECKIEAVTEGYLLNAGGNSSTNQTILCDTSSCATKHVNPGYYLNRGSDDVIKCDLNTCTSITAEGLDCGTVEKSSAYVCLSEQTINFYKSDDVSVAFNVTGSNDIYLYDSLKQFPSINSEITTLYRLTNLSVERYISNGVVTISTSTNQKISEYSEANLGTDYVLYDCSSTTKVCTKRSSCVTNTYMYDVENQTALYCNSGKLESVSSKGYYIDGVSTVGTKTPYIINCNENKVCTQEAPSGTSYFVNADSNNNTNNPLIYCSNSNCYTVTASAGYYVANQQAGIINCTSSSSCEFKEANAAGSNANYVNAGANKGTYALISCNKKECKPKAANTGYYFSSRVTTLIYCESSNSCSEVNPTVNYYFYADTGDSKNYIINCSKVSTSIVCSKEVADTGSYLTSQPNVLITCTKNGTCKQINAKPGYYQSAVKITINSKRDVTNAEESEVVSDIAGRDSTTTYNIIECTTTNCELLSAEELSSIPVCEYSSDKCYITIAYAMSKNSVTSISAGNICTNADRSKFYFATDTIVVAPSVIAGQTATYVYTTTTTNCLIADSKYKDYYYTVGSDIYRINDGSVSHFYDSGYYFINVDKNTLVSSNNVDNYNNENVKLYKCNGVTCKILDEPENPTYYADVNKRIVKYNVNSNSYVFAYDKDITCIFANNKCTPNADLNSREFCITYKGEICLAAADIKNRETGDCYRAGSVNNYIYGYNQYLYRMDVNSATIVDKNGYYLVSLSTNNTVATKDYKNRMVNSNSIKIYGCYNSNCKVYDPEAGVYYYDENAKTMLKNENDAWVAPSVSGYALVSVNPSEKYVYKFKTELDEVTLLSKAASGYYYTIDNEMYECDENDNTCTKIEESDYYFTNTGEIYYCIYDSENLEKTECTKQSCYVGQNYYISENYYRCEAGSYLTPIKSRNCKYEENVIVNFPTILKEEFPANIKQAIENIEKNNNSTAVAVRSNKKYLSVVPAIFTNCTYNVEETEASYDFVCLNNYVSVNDEDDTMEICSIENLGFVECVEDEANPEKCNPSGAFSRAVFNVFTLVFAALASLYIVLN